MFKKIEAYIRPEKLNEVKVALHKIGIVGMSITEVQGHGRQGGITLSGRSSSYKIDWLERILLTIVISEKNLEKTIKGIRKSVYTGEVGDGVIFVSSIEDVIHISSGDRGEKAMQYPGDIDTK